METNVRPLPTRQGADACQSVIGGNILSLSPSTSDASNLLKSAANSIVSGEMCACIFPLFLKKESSQLSLRSRSSTGELEGGGGHTELSRKRKTFRGGNGPEGPKFSGVLLDPGVVFLWEGNLILFTDGIPERRLKATGILVAGSLLQVETGQAEKSLINTCWPLCVGLKFLIVPRCSVWGDVPWVSSVCLERPLQA